MLFRSGSISGEFEKNDGSESVGISLVNNNQISFQFRDSGIGAYADASGGTAVYNGDDGYSITFEQGGDVLSITVTGEGGENSPVNGVYYRVVDGNDAGSAPAEDDQDDTGYSDAQQ